MNQKLQKSTTKDWIILSKRLQFRNNLSKILKNNGIKQENTGPLSDQIMAFFESNNWKEPKYV